MQRALLVALAGIVLASLLVVPLGAEEGAAPDYGDTYTAEELAALDRALHAVNCDRGDLGFDRDQTKGLECLPVVRKMLREPLEIAPHMDAWAKATRLDAEERPLATFVQRVAEGIAGGPLGRGMLVPTPAWNDVVAMTKPDDLLARLRVLVEAMDPMAGRSDGPPEPWARQLQDPGIRAALPAAMAWHDVFASPFDEGKTKELETALEAKEPAWLHEEAAEVSLRTLLRFWLDSMPEPGVLRALPPQAFPQDEPLVVDSPLGRIALGTPKGDVYEGHYAVLIDPGGNDRYVNCRIGAADGWSDEVLGLFADLGGDDVYACGGVNFTLGAAILGIAAFYDLGQGDDHYEGGHASLGAAMGGIATFYDDGGSDVYEGKTFTQGAAGFGLGLFFDDAVQAEPETSSDEGTKDPVDIGLFDNDRLSAWANAQAFARCKGVALCVNTRGNDVYQAGGVYLHAPLFSDRYQSFSQGFAIGARNIDYAGGIAMLIDRDGNDRYLGDIYNQGVGYWYSAGLLWDGGGNDTYEMTQYGQGSGIHLAVGGLVDVDGHDTYVMHSGLGQGGSHDYACSILHDRGGNDRYHGSTSCNGSGLTNSVGLHFDRSGDDVYAGRKKSGVNFGRPARGFGSLGILLDLDGNDDYLGVMDGHRAWRQTDVGVGLDLERQKAEKAPGNTPAADQPSGNVEIPEICAYEGELKPEVFQELWDIARRWEVGDNRQVVPKARARLIAFGKDVLGLLDEKVETDVSGLDMRAYVGVLKGLTKAEEGEAVRTFLTENATHELQRRRRVALHLIGELGETQLAPLVVEMLKDQDEALARRAAGVIAKLGSRDGDAVLRTWLAEDASEAQIRAALPVVMGAEDGASYEAARPLLDHPLISVRGTLAALVAKRLEAYGALVDRDLGDEGLPARARRTLLDAVARAKAVPSPERVVRVLALLGHEDWGMRADAARVLRTWTRREDTPAAVTKVAHAALERLLEHEEDPFVRFAAQADR